MAAGRPTKYRKKFCEMLIDHMSEGLSFSSFGGRIGVSRDTLFKWVNDHVEFSDAKNTGMQAHLLKFEKIGIAGMMGKIPGFKESTWRYFMTNIHGWRTQLDITSDDEPIEPVQIFLPDNGLRINEDE